MKKLAIILGVLMLTSSLAFAQNAADKIDYFTDWAKDNPAPGEELAEIYVGHPDWRGAMWGNEEKMKWILDNSEKYPMASLVAMEYADNHSGFAEWMWKHPAVAKRALIYANAHRRAAKFAAKHPGMARWVKNHPVKARWLAHRAAKHPVATKKIIKKLMK